MTGRNARGAAARDAAAGGADGPRVVTVGHSTHPIEEFIGLLRGAGVGRVVDVRTLRGSRHNPQYDEEELGPSLRAAGIEYEAAPRLGGFRHGSSGVGPAVNAYWEHASFHRYADYALGEDFAAGLEALIALAADGSRIPAIMCAEAVWWRCHRRIIADHLIARGVGVEHLMPDGRLVEASLTPGARVGEDGTVTYPPEKG